MGQLHRRRHLQFPHHEHCTVLHSLLPVSNTTALWLLALVFVTCSGTLFTAAEGKSLADVTSPVEQQRVFKRSATEASDYPDYQAGVRYDEYPVSGIVQSGGTDCEQQLLQTSSGRTNPADIHLQISPFYMFTNYFLSRSLNV
jgi:hypothetical protein